MIASEAKILADIARATWENDKPGTRMPREQIPRDERTVTDWIIDDEERRFSQDVEEGMLEYVRRFVDLYGSNVIRAPCDGLVTEYDLAFFGLHFIALGTLHKSSDTPLKTGSVQASDRVPEVWRKIIGGFDKIATERVYTLEAIESSDPPLSPIPPIQSVILLDVYHDVRATSGTKHPIASLIAIWQRRTVPAEWDNRSYTNLPGSLANTQHTVPPRVLSDGQVALPFDWDDLALKSPPADAARFEVVGYLPTLGPEPSKLVPTALLSLWDVAGLGGASSGRNGPVPVPRRIGLAVLLATPPHARVNESVYVDTTLGGLAAAVWPKTVRPRIPDDPKAGVVGYRESRHGRDLMEALTVVHGPKYGSVAWSAGKDGARRILVTVRDWPRTPAADERVGFVVALPPGSQQGPMVDAFLLRELAAVSNRQHRLMLTAYCLWDRYGTVKGRLINPTIPVVEQNDAGYVTNAHGKIITEHGAPTRRVTHRHAVQTGKREPNPEVDRYPWLRGNDLILATSPFVAETPGGRRMQRSRTHQAAQEMRDARHLDFDIKYQTPVHGGPREMVALRLLPTPAHLKAHAGRWAARKHDRAGRTGARRARR